MSNFDPNRDEQAIYEALREPFTLDELEWRVQLTGKDRNKPGDKAMMLPYVDARAIMRRFSTVLGIGHWRTATRREGAETWICRIEAKIGDDWVWHEDVSDETDIEATKGGASKALVRCAVRFGVGAYLYEMDFQWVVLEGQPGGKGYPPRNWRPEISKIPAQFRPSKAPGRAASAAPPATATPQSPPPDPTPPVQRPVGDAVPVGVQIAQIMAKVTPPKAREAWERIKWAWDLLPCPVDLTLMSSKDPAKAEPLVFFAEAALRTGPERMGSGHWSKMRWAVDEWPQKEPSCVETHFYKRLLAIDKWAAEIRDMVPDKYISEMRQGDLGDDDPFTPGFGD